MNCNCSTHSNENMKKDLKQLQYTSMLMNLNIYNIYNIYVLYIYILYVYIYIYIYIFIYTVSNVHHF